MARSFRIRFSTRKRSSGSVFKKIKYIAIIFVIFLLIASALLFFPREKIQEEKYEPTVDLPQDYMVLVEEPKTVDDIAFISILSSIVVRGDVYHPMFILDEGKLDQHQLWSIEQMDLQDLPVLLFSDNPDLAANLADQVTVNENHTYPKKADVLMQFKGFDGFVSVSSAEEALWVAPLANVENKVMKLGDPTYSTQEEVWDAMREHGINADYVVIANPYDVYVELLEATMADYDMYDSQFHIPALSAVAAELAAYHKAYVITNAPVSYDEIGVMDTQLNSRSIGYYNVLRSLSARYGMPEYICIVGSAAAVPQFQLPGNGDGDNIVSCDVIFGFLDDDKYTMDSAVGRIVNLNVQGASNQLVRTFLYDRFSEFVTVDYSDIAGGPRDVNWRYHGASFSGYEITYKRVQATPARWICEDYEDEGMEYEYYGPSGTGELIGDGTKNTDETDIGTICEASGFVAYRGHGSDTGSLYTLRVYGPNREEGYLDGEEAAQLDMPPQVSFFVACMNGKIHGTDFGDGAPDVEIEKLFSLNYIYGGSVVLGGATEVSYSNMGQDVYSIIGEKGAGILVEEGDHQWDLNNAWYAFFWDGIINHEEEYGTVGKALMWSENRYIKYHNNEVSPFDSTTDSDLGAHWKEVAMYVIYGDPAFKPHVTKEGANNYDPWHNGPDDY